MLRKDIVSFLKSLEVQTEYTQNFINLFSNIKGNAYIPRAERSKLIEMLEEYEKEGEPELVVALSQLSLQVENFTETFGLNTMMSKLPFFACFPAIDHSKLYSPSGTLAGSGAICVVIKEQQYVVTAAHVIFDRVSYADGEVDKALFINRYCSWAQLDAKNDIALFPCHQIEIPVCSISFFILVLIFFLARLSK